MINIDDLLKKISLTVVGEMKKIIVSNRRMATRKLLNSITYKIVKEPNGKYERIDFYALPYGNYVDKGRGPTHSGGGGKTLVKAIEEWLKVKKIGIKRTGKKPKHLGMSSIATKKTTGARKSFTMKTDAQIKGVAYAIARSIHKKGWKTPPSPHGAIYFTKPIDENIQKACDAVYFYYAEKAKDALKNEFKK